MPYADYARQREAWKRYYDRNPELFAERRRIRRQAVKDFVTAEKSRPCVDCEMQYSPWVMQFDHVKGDKLFNINDAVRVRKSLKAIADEIAKCEVVCANCHADRTYWRAVEAAQQEKGA